MTAMRLAAETTVSGNASECVAAATLRGAIDCLERLELSGTPPDAGDLADWTARAGDAVDAAERAAGDAAAGGGSDAAAATRLAAAELAACAAYVVFVARRWRDAAAEFVSGRAGNRAGADAEVEGSSPSGAAAGFDADAERRRALRVLGDATATALARLVGGDGAVAFRRRSGAARAATLARRFASWSTPPPRRFASRRLPGRGIPSWTIGARRWLAR